MGRKGTGYALGSLLRHSLATLLATTALGVVAAHAVDGTWAGATTEWTDGTNWTSNPDVPDGTATFTNTGSNTVDSNGVVNIGSVVFTAAPNAQAYTVTTNDIFVVNGAGISNNSTNVQTFNVSSSMAFTNSSSASGGSNVVTYNVSAGAMIFNDTSTAGSANITNNGDVEFNGSSNAGTATITNNIVMNFNDASSANNANITNAATGFLSFNTSATAGTSTISNSGSLSFAGSASAGSATITTENFATTSFTGTATGGNARFITNAGGIVDISGLTSAGMTAGSIEGAGSYVLGAKTLTTGGNNASTQVDGVISGNGGGLTKVGTGTLTLTGGNSYTGATIVSAGTLALSGFGIISGSSLVTVNATLDISAIIPSFAAVSTLAGNSSGVVNLGSKGLFITNGSTEFAGVIQGTGGLEVGGGTQTLSGVNTYSNVTQIDGGATLALKGSGSIANSLYVALAGGGATLDISQTTSGASVGGLFSASTAGVVSLGSKTLTITSGTFFGGVIQDGGIGGGTGGNLAIANGATQQLFGTNTYTGTTNIAAGGELDLIDFGGLNGSIATSSNVIANGIFDIAGLLNGGTSIKSLAGSGNVNLGANMLTISNGIGNFSGVIDDAGFGGGLTVAGGTQTLSGNNTYTGATTVNGGALVVDGSILNSPTTVNTGGTLAGSGTVAGVQVNGGTLAPGSAANPFGPLTVNGSLIFTAASTYLVQVSSGNASLTQVTGATDLGGATVRANFTSGTVKKQYTILTAAGSLTNTTFNPTVVSNMPTINAKLSYDTSNVFLNVNVDFAQAGGLNVNQQNVANTLTNFFNATGGIPAAFAALSPAGLTTASGELGTGIIQSAINADGQFLNLMLDPTVIGRSGGFAKAGSVAQFAESDDMTAYAKMRPANAREREAYAMATKAPLLSPQPSSRWSVWFGRCRRQCAGRLARPDRTGLGRRCRRRLQGLGGHAGRLRARRRRAELLGCECDGLGLGRYVPGRRLWPPQFRTCLRLGRARLWLARRHHQPHRGARRLRPAAGPLQGRHVLGSLRGRLSLRDAAGRHHALCGGAGDELQPAQLLRSQSQWRRPVRAELRLAVPHRHPLRARPAHRQGLCDAERRTDAARPRRLGARLQSEPCRHRAVPDPARHQLCRERRQGRRRLRAPQRQRRDEMVEWLLDRRHLRRRVLRQRHQLFRQGRVQVQLVS